MYSWKCHRKLPVTKKKCHFFSFTKSKNRRMEQVLPGGWEERGVDSSGSGEGVGKKHGKVNMVQILCTHVGKWKIRPVETVPGMGQGGMKENVGGDELKYDIFDTL
jgi:hypothetical protein